MPTLPKRAAHRVREAADRLFSRSLLLPMMVSFVCFIGCVLLILSIWFTRNVAATLEDVLYENAGQSAGQTVSQLSDALRGVTNIAAHLSYVNALSPRAFSASSYDAYQAIKEYDSPFNFSQLAVYYADNPLTLSTRGTSYAPVLFSEVTQLDALLDTLGSTTRVTLLSTSLYGAAPEQSRLMLLYPLSSRHSAIFFFDSSMLASHTGVSSGVKALLDPQGRLLWSSRELPASSIAQLAAQANQQAQPRRRVMLDGTDYIYSSGLLPYGGATLVVLDPITTQFDRLHALIGMMGVVCAVILLLGVLLLVFSIRRGYMPIAHLVRDIRSTLPPQPEGASSDIATLKQIYSNYSALLQESRKNAALFSGDQLRAMFVLRAISGRYTDEQELHNLCRWLEIELPHPYFLACLLLFERAPGEQERRAVEECLNSLAHPGAVALFNLLPDGQSAVGVVNLDTDDPARLRAFGEALLAALPAAMPATAGLGQIVGDFSSLGKSYLEAHAALDYRLIKGRNTLITYDEIRLPETATAYPRPLIESYINTLSAWDVEGIRAQLEQIADYIRSSSLSLQQVKCICYDLTSAFLRRVSSLDHRVSYRPNASYDVFSIAEYDSVSDLVQKITGFSENIQQYIERCDEHREIDLIESCQRYLEENVPNAQFSLTACAERFDIAPQTLRRKFKEATGTTLSAYMTALRIDRAKALLVTTQLDIGEICTQCGYVDPSSFIRLFRSETGVSPGKYREIHRRADAPSPE